MTSVIVSHAVAKETSVVELSAAHAPATTKTRLMALGVEITVTVVVVIVIVAIASDVGVATRANCATEVGTVLAATAVVAIVEGTTAVIWTTVSQIVHSCTPDRNCHPFCLGDKIASHPGVLTQSKKNTQNLEINQIFGVVVQEKESNMVLCSRWKFPTLGMTVLSGTSAEPRFRSARSSLGLETSI